MNKQERGSKFSGCRGEENLKRLKELGPEWMNWHFQNITNVGEYWEYQRRFLLYQKGQVLKGFTPA